MSLVIKSIKTKLEFEVSALFMKQNKGFLFNPFWIK